MLYLADHTSRVGLLIAAQNLHAEAQNPHADLYSWQAQV